MCPDKFGGAKAHGAATQTELTSVSYHSFWRHINTIVSNSVLEATAERWQRFLDINPEGKLLQESQDICEELMILLRVYGQQITVIKEFRRHLATLREDEWLQAEKGRAQARKEKAREAKSPEITLPEHTLIEFAVVRKLDRLLSWHLDTSMSPFSDDDDIADAGGTVSSTSVVPTQEADVLLELVESRRLELHELEETASRTCKQV